jgi:hypothetical protein
MAGTITTNTGTAIIELAVITIVLMTMTITTMITTTTMTTIPLIITSAVITIGMMIIMGMMVIDILGDGGLPLSPHSDPPLNAHCSTPVTTAKTARAGPV